MISVTQMCLQRGGKPLFDHASLTIHAGQRVAIIGVNGCGKSTLFQLLLKELSVDAGEIEMPANLRIAHMAQEVSGIEREARDYIIDGHKVLRELEQALAQAEQEGNDMALASLHAQMDAIDGYRIKHQVEAIMLGLGFSSADYTRPVASFSGGWRIRLNLARALVCPSDVLLLDEPTNHLDIEAIHWLEEWLQHYPGSVLLISHDRDFIDAVASHIVHIEDQKIHSYKGSYSAFERQRAEKLMQQQSLYEKQQVRKAELQRFIDRFKAKATKAKQAQSRIKALERMQLVSAVREASAYHFQIPCAEKAGNPLVNWFNVDIGYPGKPVLRKCNFSIQPGMRIGLLGANGAGKSTLIKTLAQEQTILSGEAEASEHLKIGYFAQHQLEALDLDASPVLHLQRLSPAVTEQSIRDFLGSFRIHGEMALGNIRNFSGGEKARLALAIVAWHKPNLLLMDEPTNHLDIEMREALAEALQAFAGAVLLVSHDRYLLRHCVDEFWLVDEGQVRTFEGDLQDYYDLKKQQGQQRNNMVEEKKVENKKLGRQEAAQKRAQLAPLTKAVRSLENDMDKIQQQLDGIIDRLSGTDIYEAEKKSELQRLLAEEAALKAKMENLEQQWFEKQEVLQQLENAG